MKQSSLEGKTVLVTGANGFIGQRLIQQLQTIPRVTIIALSRQPACQANYSLRWLQADLQELTPQLWQDQQIHHIDLVFHLGAFIPKSAKDANNVAAIFSDNLQGTRCLLENLPNQPERIIFASTVDVYDSGATIINEESRLAPSNLYGSSKLFGEQLVKFYASQLNCAYSILRYGHIYGPGEMAYRKFIPESIRKVLLKQAPVVYGDGSTTRDFLYVDDAVEATLRAATHTSSELGPINVVSGHTVTLREIIETLVSFSDDHIDPEYLLDKENGASLRFDNKLMLKSLGNWVLVPLKIGLQKEYVHFSQHSI